LQARIDKANADMEFAKKQREAMGLDKDPSQDDGMTTADETTRVKKD
jgi:hypothetical protein